MRVLLCFVIQLFSAVDVDTSEDENFEHREWWRRWTRGRVNPRYGRSLCNDVTITYFIFATISVSPHQFSSPFSSSSWQCGNWCKDAIRSLLPVNNVVYDRGSVEVNFRSAAADRREYQRGTK